MENSANIKLVTDIQNQADIPDLLKSLKMIDRLMFYSKRDLEDYAK